MAETRLPELSNIPLKHARVLKGPHQLAFDITNKCNYRCLHCFNLSGENIIMDDELNDEEVIEFITDIAELKPFNLCFCGGEPMLRVDIIYQAARILSSKGAMVSMVTNGSLVTKEKAKDLLSSGVSRVQVSLDGARPATHERLRRHKDAYNHATHAIMYFREVGYKNISVAFSPTSFNYGELADTYHLCVELGANNFRVQPLMILGRVQISRQILPTPIQYREIVKTVNILRGENGIPIEWGDPVDHLIRFRTMCEHCVNFANVKANGSIEVSPYIPLTVGNVRRHRFSQYWDAGLARIWELEKVKKLASKILSVSDFGKTEKNVPKVWFDKDIEIDLIDSGFIKGG